MGGKSGHISKALLPQPQAKALAGPLESTSAGAGAVAVAVPVGSAWQGPTGQGTVAAARAAVAAPAKA